MPKSEFLGLEITTDENTNFEDWSKSINGDQGSNALIIDAFAKNVSESIDNTYGVGDSVILSASAWIGNAITIEIEGLNDHDAIIFGPSTLFDKQVAETAGVFPTSIGSYVTFTCEEKPSNDISFNCFIVRGKNNG